MTKLTLDDIARAVWEENRKVADWLGVGSLPWEEEAEALRENWRTFTGAALNTIHQAGYAIVPVEATEAMRVAGIKVPIDPNNEITWLIADEARRVWQAMLNAAPQIEGSE